MRDNLFSIQMPVLHFESIKKGVINSWHVRGMKAKYEIGDELVFIEYDDTTFQEKEGRIYATVVYSLMGSEIGLPEDCCFVGFHTSAQIDYIRDYSKIANEVLPAYESKLTYKVGGNIIERLSHVLSEYDSIAGHSVFQAKHFVEDVKTQFKALELVMEGITSDSLNHTQKRTIANHVIHMLRSMVDRIDEINWEYTTRNFERYNYFRSRSPERSLLEKYRELKGQMEHVKQQLKGKGQIDELPF